MGEVVKLPDHVTEYQAAVIQLRAGQNKNLLKFVAFMILFFIGTGLIFGMVVSVSNNAKEILHTLSR